MRIPLNTPLQRAAPLVILALIGACDSGKDPVAVEAVEETTPTVCQPVGTLAVPDTAEGTLAAGECQLNERYVDVWVLDVDVAQELTIDLSSEEFDPILTLLDAEGQTIGEDDDGGLGVNARFSGEYAAGRYYLYASSYYVHAQGAYQLSVHQGPPVSPCPPTNSLAFPDTVTGSVTAGACQINGYYVDVWRLELPVDTTVTLYVESPDLEPLVGVLDPTGEIIAFQVQTPDRTWLEMRLPAGSYDIWVSDAYTPGETGSYTLAVAGGPAVLQCPAAGTIAVGDTVQGEIGENECLVDYLQGEAWEMELSDSVDLAISVRADGLYPVLWIVSGSGDVITEGWGNESMAMIDVELGPGTYRLLVLVEPWRQGAYELVVNEGPTTLSCPATGTLSLGEPAQGKITSDDCLLDWAQGDAWELDLADSTHLAIAVDGELPYPLLRVVDANGEDVVVAYGDEWSAALDVIVGPGQYRIWVLGYWEPEFQGTYTLTAWDAGATPACDTDGPVAPGDTVQGALSSTDCSFPDGRYGDLWTLQLDSSMTVTITVESDKIDPYLLLADSAGSVIAEDDDGGSGLNAALTVELDAGTYQIWATSFDAGALGAYRLLVQAGAGDTAADAGAEATEKDGQIPEVRRWVAAPPSRARDVPPFVPALIAPWGASKAPTSDRGTH